MKKIQYLLREANLTQNQLAEELAIKPQNLSRLLNNEDIKLSTLTKIAAFFGKKTSELVSILLEEKNNSNSTEEHQKVGLKDIHKRLSITLSDLSIIIADQEKSEAA